MKQKITLILIIIILIITFTFLGTNFVYASENEMESTTMIFEKVESKEQINVSMKINENEGITSFQTSLTLESSNLNNIQNATINWHKNIINNAILKTASYNKSTGILNLYVVSKIELTEVTDKGNIVLNIGTISLTSDNTSDMKVQIVAGKTVFGDIAHNRKEVQANTNIEKIDFTITAKSSSENPDTPDNPNNPDNPSNPDEPNNPDRPNDSNKPEDGETQIPSTPNDKPSNDGTEIKDGKYNGMLPFTGLLTDYKVLFATLVVLIIIAIVIIVKKCKDKFRNK